MQIEIETEIARPPAEVFAFLANAENMPHWRTGLQQVRQVSEGPPRKGTQYRFVREKPRVESTMEWVEFEQDRRLAWGGAPASIGPATVRFSGSHNLSPSDGGGTHLRCVFNTEFGGVGKLIGPLVHLRAKRELEANFQTLKRIIEGGSAHSAGS
jgi:uncharacterized protein YndB with AHSA1/START domain